MNIELKIPPPLVVVISSLAMWVLTIVFPTLTIYFAWSRILALAFALTGIVIALKGQREFKKARTTTNPTKPETATSLITSGIYSRTRNPMYVGLLLLLTGWAIYLSHALSIVVLVGFVAYMNRFQILPEERALTSIFGTEYHAYKQSVRRWL